MFPVNEVNYDGPQSWTGILHKIREDAVNEGMDHLTLDTIRIVIQRVFSTKGALSGLLYLKISPVHGFGRFYPDSVEYSRKMKRINRTKKYRYEIGQKHYYLKQFKSRNHNFYQRYLKKSTAEVKLDFNAWMRVHGREAQVNKRRKELKKITLKFHNDITAINLSLT